MPNMTPPEPAGPTEDAPGPEPQGDQSPSAQPHAGVVLKGRNGEDGRKAFYIHIEARPGKEADVIRMLENIFHCVLDEPGTGPWFGVRYSPTVFGIFEAFPNIAARNAHVAGGGGDIFRDVERMNDILVRPASVYRVDVLLQKKVFAE